MKLLFARAPRSLLARAVVVLGALLLVASAARGDTASAAQKNLELRQQALKAHNAKDWPAFLEAEKKLYDLDPARPGNLFNLACAQARNSHFEAAARLLNELLDRGVDYGIATFEDLKEAAKSPAFHPLLAREAELSKPLGGSTVAFRLGEKDLLTEGIAFDPSSGAFFVSSVHHRKIVKRTADGSVSDFIAQGQDGILGVFALAVDGPRHVLWAASAAVPQMKDYKAGEDSTGLFAFDLASGKLARKLVFASDRKPHVFNDLAVADNGDVYTTDSVGGGIYVARAGSAAIEEFIAPGVFRSPQGLAFTSDGSRLYVADYGSGLFAVDPKTRQRREVTPPAGTSLIGIDGLARYGNDLVVTQNLLVPHRVVRLTLDASGLAVARATVLDRADPEFAEPTLCVIAHDAVFVVGKSQWQRFNDATGAVDTDRLVEPAILEIPLRPAG